MRTIRTVLYLLIVSALTAATAHAWIYGDGIPICQHEENDFSPCIASDGAGGAIIAWSCLRPHPHPKGVFANRINGNGNLLWIGCGTQVNEPEWFTHDPVDIVADGSGGAVICWAGFNGDATPSIRAERVNAAGGHVWSGGGVELWSGEVNPVPTYPRICSDEAGGAVVVWYEQHEGNYNLVARRVDGTGTPLWTSGGVDICTEEHQQQKHRIVSDGAGGAIIVWRDSRGTYNDVYAQRIDASGTVRWTVDGIPICTYNGAKDEPRIVPDGLGGAIITWEDADIMAQRVDGDGTLLWGPDGVTVCGIVGGQSDPQIASDGANGAVLSWRDTRSGAWGVYAQRLNPAGEALWTDQGIAVVLTTENDILVDTYIVGGGALDGSGGGAVIVWQRRKTNYDYDLYARVVSPGGILLGEPDGSLVCGDLTSPQSIGIATDMAGGAIISWNDGRGGAETEGDIFAARVDGSGVSEVVLPARESARLDQNHPNPFNPHTTIRFDLPAESFVELTVYSVAGRRIATLVSGLREQGPHSEVWNGREDGGRLVASGTYFYRLSTAGYSETKRMTLVK
ncbi:MAG: T9SS type A sorting domain-containing protein [bacterium]|nr:T9SS type A sorting domain-containing protein [bacterium]